MLTRDLLQFRVHQGRIRPRFVDVEDASLFQLAGDLVEIAAGAAGATRGDLALALEARAREHRHPKVAKGLLKLVVDRVETEEPGPEADDLRRDLFSRAAAVFRALPDEARVGDYEASLEAMAPEGIEQLRARLYADLVDQRRVTGWKPLTALGLLERYNMALAQGLVLHARRLSIVAIEAGLVEARRVLRWMKFCRLVFEMRRDGSDWSIEVEGPGAVLEMHKKYGLQLATFLPAVPLLGRFSLEADIELPRRPRARLVLDHRDPLVSPYRSGLGHVPDEIAHVLSKLDAVRWDVDLTPEPRHVGANGTCVPDLLFRLRGGTRVVAIELFHRWHRDALARRLDELDSRPDTDLFLGVERALFQRDELRARLEASPQVFSFNKFPSARVLRSLLEGLETEG